MCRDLVAVCVPEQDLREECIKLKMLVFDLERQNRALCELFQQKLPNQPTAHYQVHQVNLNLISTLSTSSTTVFRTWTSVRWRTCRCLTTSCNNNISKRENQPILQLDYTGCVCTVNTAYSQGHSCKCCISKAGLQATPRRIRFESIFGRCNIKLDGADRVI